MEDDDQAIQTILIGLPEDIYASFLIAQKEEARIQLQAEEFDLMTTICDIDEIEEVNANCILMTNLQQASILGTRTDKAPVYDSYRSSEVFGHENEGLLSVVARSGYYVNCLQYIILFVDTSNLRTELDPTKEKFENSYNNMQHQIERLEAQLGDLKGQSMNTQCESDTIDPLS
ncbi:hypothetical protein Tco_0115306 [Tanacetum coccineum]